MNRFENIINNFVLWGNDKDELYAALIMAPRPETTTRQTSFPILMSL